ncbi:MAG TPA: 5-oxoprolinase subunit PxpA [Negativicutes bacterium]|nr:5-oxoprolinase subunit PxpA [Negativicutes bacterium]
MRNYVDLNSDVGESYGAYKLGLDEEVLKHVSSVNIACGWHAGDPMVMEKTIALAENNKLGIGAHPGYPDLIGFGRRNLDVTPKEVRNYLIYQIGALDAFAKAAGTSLQHVKLHGAFYNTVSANAALAKEAAKAIYDVDKSLVVLALAGSELVKAAKELGLKVAEEVFADRAYNADGSLVSRKLPGAVIHDKELAIQRVKRMVTEGKVAAIDGTDAAVNADSICVHGDNPEAVAFVKLIRERLESDGIWIKPLRETL